MFRILQFLALVLCSLCPWAGARATNTYFWLSTQGFPSASPLPGSPGAIPEFYNFNTQPGGSIYIWGRPEAAKTLNNWSLNLFVDNPNIFQSTSSVVFKSNVTGATRWQNVNEPTSNTALISNIAGFNPTSLVNGISSATQGADLYFDFARTAWLIARVDYMLQPFSTFQDANLFLQIGSLGITNKTGSSVDVNVVFGDDDDTPLNGFANRGTSSVTRDGVIKYFAKPDADFDGDTDVDGRDFLIWQRNFGTLVGAPNAMGNANPEPPVLPGKDGQVNKIDLAAWQFQYGMTVIPTLVDSLQAVPEPSAMTLAFWAVSGTLTTCRPRRYGTVASNSQRFPYFPATRQIQHSSTHVFEGG